jgi:glycosyltransferase involved in cell wall biosynthesis
VLVHDAGRTGAPIVLLRLFRQLARQHDLRLTFLLQSPGPLVADFAALGEVVYPSGAGRWSSRLRRLGQPPLTGLVERWNRWSLTRRLDRPDVIYSNTLANGRLLEQVSKFDAIPVITHVHELPRYLGQFTTRAELDVVRERTTHWIVPSEAVREALPTVVGAAATHATLVRECIDLTDDPLRSGKSGRSVLAVESNELVVGACGTVDLRKGADLFGLLARSVLARWDGPPSLAFRWLGGDLESDAARRIVEDVEAMGLGNTVRFVGSTPSPYPALAAMDVFALLSREDPYPLAMLEAAALARPIVCFDGSGGAPEFVNRGAGESVSYLDIETMAAAIVHLLRDPATRRDVGTRARELALEHDARSAAQEVWFVIDEALVSERESRRGEPSVVSAMTKPPS